MEQTLTICGLDESGRGALAGPLVLAGVVLPRDFTFEKVTPTKIRDSKKLSFTQRLKAMDVIKQYSLKIDVEVINVEDINQNGIQWANIEGFRRLIRRIYSNQYIVDGNLKIVGLEEKQQSISSLIDADATLPAAMAAGIVAKCTRDQIMFTLSKTYPDYKWQSNVGYGTSLHIKALHELGITPHHRVKFVNTVFGL